MTDGYELGTAKTIEDAAHDARLSVLLNDHTPGEVGLLTFPHIMDYGRLFLTLSSGEQSVTQSFSGDERAEVWYSDDFGGSFEKIDLIEKIDAFSVSDPIILWRMTVTREGTWLVPAVNASTNYSRILRSTDEGETWTVEQEYDAPSRHTFRNIHEDPEFTGIYTASGGDSEYKLWKSTDDGQTWGEIGTGIGTGNASECYKVHTYAGVSVIATRSDSIIWRTGVGDPWQEYRTKGNFAATPLYDEVNGRWIVTTTDGWFAINNTPDLSADWFDAGFQMGQNHDAELAGDTLVFSGGSPRGNVWISPDMGLSWTRFDVAAENTPWPIDTQPIYTRVATHGNDVFVGEDRTTLLTRTRLDQADYAPRQPATWLLWDDESITAGDSTPYMPTFGRDATVYIVSDSAGEATIEAPLKNYDQGGATRTWYDVDTVSVSANDLTTYAVTTFEDEIRLSFDSAASITAFVRVSPT